MSSATRTNSHFGPRSSKRTTYRPAPRIALFAAAVTAAFAAATQAASAQTSDRAAEYEIGSALVCETQAEVERFANVFSGDAGSAVMVVNDEAGDATACAMMNVVYLRGTRIDIVRNGDSAFEVVRVLVVGVETKAGIVPIGPSVRYSLFAVKEFGI